MTQQDRKLEYTVSVKDEGLEKLGKTLNTTEDAIKDLGTAATTAGAGADKLNASAEKAGIEITELSKAVDDKMRRAAELKNCERCRCSDRAQCHGLTLCTPPYYHQTAPHRLGRLSHRTAQAGAFGRVAILSLFTPPRGAGL